MTKIIYFVTPTSFVTIGTKAAEFLPILGPTVKYTKKAQKVTALTNPISATSRGIGVMFDYCFGPAGAVTAECILWFVFSAAGGATCNPTLIAVGAEFGGMVLDDIFD